VLLLPVLEKGPSCGESPKASFLIHETKVGPRGPALSTLFTSFTTSTQVACSPSSQSGGIDRYACSWDE
jgi:hypothetical protein